MTDTLPQNSVNYEGDPTLRMQRVLEDDMLRLEIRKSVDSAINKYRARYGAEPVWARIPLIILTRNGGQVYQLGDNVCGLTAVPSTDFGIIEVGASSFDNSNED